MYDQPKGKVTVQILIQKLQKEKYLLDLNLIYFNKYFLQTEFYLSYY